MLLPERVERRKLTRSQSPNVSTTITLLWRSRCALFRFFAYYPANSSPAAVLGDMLASMFNVIGFSWESCPASTELEILVLGAFLWLYE